MSHDGARPCRRAGISFSPERRCGELEHGRQDEGKEDDRQRDQQGRSDEFELDRPYIAGTPKRPLRPKGDPRTRGATWRTTCTRPRPDLGRSRALAGRPSPPGRRARRPATVSVVADEPHLKPRCSRAGLALATIARRHIAAHGPKVVIRQSQTPDRRGQEAGTSCGTRQKAEGHWPDGVHDGHGERIGLALLRGTRKPDRRPQWAASEWSSLGVPGRGFKTSTSSRLVGVA